MALFQTSVLQKYLLLQKEDTLQKLYKKYTKYFHNLSVQDNIKNSKEEEYQGIFLTELFVSILGYTLKPNPNFNLVAEYKNQNNARKADGAILKGESAIAVIELKGTKTKDLESIRKQAFDYKANQKGCTYIITSNFEKLRFYINDATEFEEFNLFTLTKKQFDLLYLCLSKENIYENLPLTIKEESLTEEKKITDGFYKDYSLFKRELYRDLVKKNAKNLKDKLNNTVTEENEIAAIEKNVKLTLFKKSQKLIDRFLFIFFAEDRGLLPPNSTAQILNKWKDDNEFGDERPLYNLFKQYFNFLDTGRKGTPKRAEIYAYNGGLFKTDSLLDSLEIDNELLLKHTEKLAAYDFESQVDVNILGHIFENSLNEIESVNAEIEGSAFDKQTSKRKKDGVFYTPKYITKYIVENTIGKLCIEKKVELKLKEEEYFKGRKGRNKTTISTLVTKLDTYRDWLLQLTICDPACGSGAFLNQALDFLIKEHTYIDELKTKVLGGGFLFPDIENTILENNIFGVDLNDESVEIAKLSLWLRTAQPRRKLNNLSSNIKCGNSLIEVKAVAGDKAFKWETEFPKVFEKGGFDVIIGNPPYGAQINKLSQDYFNTKYTTAHYKLDTFSLFIEKSICLTKENGINGLIVPYTWLTIQQHNKLRKFVLDYSLTQIINLPIKVFSDADLDTVINIIRKNKTSKNVKIGKVIEGEIIFSSNLSYEHIFENDEVMINVNLCDEDYIILSKIKVNSDELQNNFEVSQGLIPYDKYRGHTPEQIKGRVFHSETKIDSTYKKELKGADISRYSLNWNNKLWISYGEWLAAPRQKKYFTSPRILIMEVTRGSKYLLKSCYTDTEYYNTPSLINIIHPKDNVNNLKFLLTLINSRLYSWLHIKTNSKANAKTSIPKILVGDIRKLPYLTPTPEKEKELIQKGELMMQNNNGFYLIKDKFINYLIQQFNFKKLSKKLQNWHELEFGDFIKEINKTIKTTNKERIKNNLEPIAILSKLDEMDWMEVFEVKKAEIQALQAQINQTDAAIDTMVYELYGLTENEIKIVENS